MKSNDKNDSSNSNPIPNTMNNNMPPQPQIPNQFNSIPFIPPINQFNNNSNNNINTTIPPPFLFNPNNNLYYNNSNSGAFLAKSLEKLKNGDDMDIMSELISLCDQLSLSDGAIGSNPNLAKLLEEVCKNLDKIYLPELVIYSLQCMNYILDINPRLANVFRKNNIITKLISLMTTIEDITCIDSIVTVLEKISLNNSILLLEGNVFFTLLNIFDFLGKSQRYSAIKCCLNISYNVLNYKQYDVYIKPASYILCNLSQYREGITDTQILEKIIDIYFNIINNFQANIKYETSFLVQLENELIKYNYFENFYDLLTRYFIERDKKINPELIKKVLTNIKIACELSTKAVDKYLSINLLTILVEIINYEFSNNQSNNDNSINNSNANSTFLTELFNVLLSLFPPIKEDQVDVFDDIKILSQQNRQYYNYFCKEILKPLINHIMSKSACSNLDNLIQLILVFIKTTDKDNIIANIDSKPISQIISKLLDTKYYVYLNDLSTLIDILMTKTSNYYMNNFLREGIIQNIQNYISDIKPENPENPENKVNDQVDENEKPIKEKDEILDLLNKLKKGEANKLELLDQLLLLDEATLNQKKEEFAAEQKILTQKKIRKLYDKYFTPEKIENYNKSSINNDKSFTSMKETLSSLEKELNENSGDIIDKNNNEKNIQQIKAIIDILTNPLNEITFFELESSNILTGLCHFLESQFLSFYDKLDFNNDNVLQKNIDLKNILPNPLVYNKNIFDKMNILFKGFENSKEKLLSFIKLLEYSITSMNCFTMIVDDAKNTNINLCYNQISLLSKTFNVKVYYDDSIYKSLIVNNYFVKDNDFKAKCSEYNFAFKSVKEYKFLLNNTFNELSSYLLSNINVPYVYNENYELDFYYFLNLNENNIHEKFTIEHNWGILELKNALIKKYGQQVAENIFGAPIYFGITYKTKEKELDNLEKINNNDIFHVNGFKESIISSLGKNFINFDNIEKEILEFDKISFIKDYHNLILFSKSLYEIKRLFPSLFLLSLMNLSITKYNKLFNLVDNFSLNEKDLEDIFINSKVSLLITKAAGDAPSISRSNLPSWCKTISLDCGFLSKFDSRQLIFKVSFDPKRSLINLQNYIKSVDPNYHSENITLEKSMRLKILVERNTIIEHGFKLLDNPVTSRFKGYLEFEYMGEIGNGLGPTLEFYRLITEKLYENKELWYKTTDNSIFPALGLNNNKKAYKLYKLLGYIISRSLYDDRLLDFPLSKIFWNLLLNKGVKLSDIKFIDKDLYKFVEDLLTLINKKKEIIEKEKDISDEDLENKVLYNGKKLNSVDIYFTFPGYEIELKPNGKNILLCVKNIEEYINLIYDFIFYKGINKVIEAFREGFNIIFNINDLRCFTPEELEENIFGGDKEKWEKETLYENLKPEHGYTKKSRIFNDLIQYMTNLDKSEQKKFLIFTTGASRLPLGGFKALSPKLTVVKKSMNGNENPDNFLPTVMTCQNYLKIPEYSSFDILKEKFNLAMNEGSNEFHLS